MTARTGTKANPRIGSDFDDFMKEEGLYDDAQAIEKEVSGVDAVAPMINLSATLVYENTNWSSSVVGSTARGGLSDAGWAVLTPIS